MIRRGTVVAVAVSVPRPTLLLCLVLASMVPTRGEAAPGRARRAIAKIAAPRRAGPRAALAELGARSRLGWGLYGPRRPFRRHHREQMDAQMRGALRARRTAIAIATLGAVAIPAVIAAGAAA